MGDYLLGEDTVDLAELGFCGETVSSAMGWKTSPQPTSPPFSIGMTRNTIRALLRQPRLHNTKEKPP
jgi:hypothetical protein